MPSSLALFGDAGRAAVSSFLRMNDTKGRESIMQDFPHQLERQ